MPLRFTTFDVAPCVCSNKYRMQNGREIAVDTRDLTIKNACFGMIISSSAILILIVR